MDDKVIEEMARAIGLVRHGLATPGSLDHEIAQACASIVQKRIEGLERALAAIADKNERQADCLEKYAEGHGFKAEPVASVFHFQASHFRDFAKEARAALSPVGVTEE